MARARKIDEVVEKLTRLEELVDRVDRRVEKIEMVTLIREPNSGMAADAYNGLRKQIIAAVTERNVHLHQLTQFDAAVRAGTNQDDLTVLVRGWLAQSGIQVVSDAREHEAFDFVGPEDGTDVRIVRPAYVDEATGRVIQMGVAERVTAPTHIGAVTDAIPSSGGTTAGELGDASPEPTDLAAADGQGGSGASAPIDGPAEGDRDPRPPAPVDNSQESTSPANQEQST
jgi:hypothetical protein